MRKSTKPTPTSAPILALLQQGRYSFEEIAGMLGVSVNVVLGVNSQFKRGRYRLESPRLPSPSKTGRTVRTDRGWTYLLVSACGRTYIGATTDLRGRFRSHNSPNNEGWTRGRKWHLLGAISYSSRAEAFDHETHLKRSGTSRGDWIARCLPRAKRLEQRHKFGQAWLSQLAERAITLQHPRSAGRRSATRPPI